MPEKEKEQKEKMVALKLTDKYAGTWITKAGTIYCDSKLPAGKKHLRVTESEAQKLIAARKESLKRQRITGECDLVIA